MGRGYVIMTAGCEVNVHCYIMQATKYFAINNYNNNQILIITHILRPGFARFHSNCYCKKVFLN